MITYEFEGFILEFKPESGEAVTRYPNERWSGCTPVAEDQFHGTALRITPSEHRVAHELAHHLIGIHVLKEKSSPVIYRDAHHLPQPEPDPQHEEWMVTALCYLAFGGVGTDWGAVLDISKQVNPHALAHRLFWLTDAPNHTRVVYR